MKKRWIVFCAAALFAAGCASALDEAKAAPKTAVEKIRQLRETVDFNHAVRSHSMIDFSRGAFAGKIVQNGWMAFPAVLLGQIAGRAAFLLLVVVFQAITPFTPALILSQIETGLSGLVLQAVLAPLLVMGLGALIDKDRP